MSNIKIHIKVKLFLWVSIRDILKAKNLSPARAERTVRITEDEVEMCPDCEAQFKPCKKFGF